MKTANLSIQTMLPTDVWHKLGRALFSAFAFVVFHTYTRLIITGRQQLPAGPFIICSNHQSHLDAIILSYVSSTSFSRSAMIAAKDYWYDHRGRFYLSRFFFNTIPISRTAELSGTFGIKHAAQIAHSFIDRGGKAIVILPEGTRSNTQKIKPFKKGIFLLAEATKLPIVPVYIEKSGIRWPKGTFFIKPGPIRVHIGEALSSQELQGADAKQLRERILTLQQAYY